jgi:hypothetical protein
MNSCDQPRSAKSRSQAAPDAGWSPRATKERPRKSPGWRAGRPPRRRSVLRAESASGGGKGGRASGRTARKCVPKAHGSTRIVDGRPISSVAVRPLRRPSRRAAKVTSSPPTKGTRAERREVVVELPDQRPEQQRGGERISQRRYMGGRSSRSAIVKTRRRSGEGQGLLRVSGTSTVTSVSSERRGSRETSPLLKQAVGAGLEAGDVADRQPGRKHAAEAGGDQAPGHRGIDDEVGRNELHDPRAGASGGLRPPW